MLIWLFKSTCFILISINESFVILSLETDLNHLHFILPRLLSESLFKFNDVYKLIWIGSMGFKRALKTEWLLITAYNYGKAKTFFLWMTLYVERPAIVLSFFLQIFSFLRYQSRISLWPVGFSENKRHVVIVVDLERCNLCSLL